MPETAARIYGPAQPGTSAANLYTVPAATLLVVRSIIIANTSDSDAWLSLSIGTTGIDTPASRIADKLNVPSPSSISHGVILLEPSVLPLAAGEFITGKQGTGSALTVTIGGILVT